jgi:hypothetical protein
VSARAPSPTQQITCAALATLRAGESLFSYQRLESLQATVWLLLWFVAGQFLLLLLVPNCCQDYCARSPAKIRQTTSR